MADQHYCHYSSRALMGAAGAVSMEPEQVIYLSRPLGGWRCVQNDEEIAGWFRDGLGAGTCEDAMITATTTAITKSITRFMTTS